MASPFQPLILVSPISGLFIYAESNRGSIVQGPPVQPNSILISRYTALLQTTNHKYLYMYSAQYEERELVTISVFSHFLGH